MQCSSPSDVDATRLDRTRVGEGQNRLVVTTITKGHTVGVEASSHTDDLVTHADTEDRLVPLLNGSAQVQSGVPALLRVSRAIGKEESIELIPDLVEVVVPGEDGDGSVAADERASDVGLGAKVEEGDLDASRGVELVNFFGGDLVDEVLLGRVPVLLGGRCREGGVLADGKSAEGGSLITQEGGDCSGIDTSDGRDVVTLAPRGEGLDGGVMGVFFSDISNDDGSALDALGLEDDSNVLGSEGCLVLGNAIVADERGGEDKDLASVGWVGHRLSVCIQCESLPEKKQDKMRT